ncbi:hypothetical protein QX776_18065 [Alteromonadaceae bacterium BrNp21-10]|nr:hypothetical protein [Alteromonadaceae bacterium BrNp21-10]
MFKNLVIAILIALLISYCFDEVLFNWFDIHIAMGEEELSGITTFAALGIGAIILVVVGFFLAMSLIGVLLFVAFIVIASVLVAGIATLWPVILMLAILVWLVRDNKQAN